MTTTTSLSLADQITRNLAVDPSLADTANGSDNPLLSFNMMNAGTLDPGMQYIDLVKSNNWLGFLPGQWGGMSQNELDKAGYLDDDGWLTDIPEELGVVAMVWTWGQTPELADAHKGTYVLTYEGEANFKMTGDARIISQEPGKIVFENQKGGDFYFWMGKTDPNETGDYLRDMSIVREEHVDLFEAGATFNPEWIEMIQDTRQIRFMGWQGTNNSSVENWDGFRGADIEDMVKLANEVGADPWFSMPHMADDDYIRKFATYVRDNLDPELTVRVEYSNEAWNWAFQQTKWLNEQSKSEWGVDAHLDYQAKLATNMALIWDDVFSGEPEDRLIKVIGGQAGNPWVYKRLMNPVEWEKNDPDGYVDPKTVFDEVAITSYFGGRVISQEETRNFLIEKIKDSETDAAEWLTELMLDPNYNDSIPAMAAAAADHVAMAEKWGMGVSGYEGGQHILHSFNVAGLTDADLTLLTDFLSEYIRSEDMGMLYEEAWNAWAEVVDSAFMQFGDVDGANKYGAWGLYESLDDSTPRSEILEYLNDTSDPWWDAVGGVHYQNGVTIIGSDQGEVHVGTAQEDFIAGKAGDDLFVLGLGNDGVHGGDGFDTVVMRGLYSDYTIAKEGDGWRVDGPEGSDFLIDIEAIRFSSGQELNLATMTVTGEILPEFQEQQEGSLDPDETPGVDDTAGSKLDLPEGDIVKTPVPASPVEIAAIGAFLDATGEGEVIFQASNTTKAGLHIGAVQSTSLLGKQLGLDADDRAYVAHVAGSTAVIEGKDVKASYWSIETSLSGKGGWKLGDDALEVAKQFGSVITNVTGAVLGTDRNDGFYGRDADDIFDGGAGNDTLVTRGGDDTAFGGAGNDKIWAYEGDDYLDGGAGDDFLGGMDGDDVLKGGAGNDTIGGGGGEDIALFSGDADDYSILFTGERFQVTGTDGIDDVGGIEELWFETGETYVVADLRQVADLAPGDPLNLMDIPSHGFADHWAFV